MKVIKIIYLKPRRENEVSTPVRRKNVRRKFFQPAALCLSVLFYCRTSIMPQVQRIIRRANNHPFSFSYFHFRPSPLPSIFRISR